MNKLETVKETIFKYRSLPDGDAEKAKLSNQVTSELEACRLLFADKENPETTIPLFSQLATLHIAYVWEHTYQKQSNDQPTTEISSKSLREIIKSYYTLAHAAVDKLINKRRSLIGVTSTDGDVTGDGKPVTRTIINDAYEGAIGKWAKREPFNWHRQLDPSDKDSNTPSGEEDMKAYVRSYTEYVINHYSAIMQLNVLDVAELWTYLLDDNKPTSPIHLTRTIYDGPFGWFAREDQSPAYPVILEGVVPACLEVWYSEWVARLKITYTDGQDTSMMGNQDGAGKSYQKHAFNKSRRLTGVKGIIGKFSRWSVRKLAWVFTGGKQGDRCGLRVGPDSMRFSSEIDRHHITDVIYYNNGSGLVLGYRLLPDVSW